MLGSKECHLYYCISSSQWRQGQQPVIVCCLFSFSIPGVLFLRVAAAPALGGNARTLWDVLLKGSNAPAAVWPGVRSMPKWYGAPKRPIYTQDGYILTEMNHSECQPPPPLTHTPTHRHYATGLKWILTHVWHLVTFANTYFPLFFLEYLLIINSIINPFFIKKINY